MKKLLPLLILLTLTFPSFAQYEYLAVTGALAGVNALKGHPQKPDEYVTQATYQGRTFPQKRSPLYKLPSKGRDQISALEQLLASRYVALQADAASPILSTEQEAAFTAAFSQLTTTRPNWSVAAYTDELAFYRTEENRRSYARAKLASEQAYQRQQRERTRRDSVERLALRRAALIDSTRRAVLAQVRAVADSVAQVQADAVAAAATPEATTASRAYTAVAPHAPVAHKPAVKKVVVKVKRSTGPTVYYCASGNTVKYHASSGCRGLARCGASIEPISLREAQASMEPCKWCY
ncbi:hypothetical protein GO988_21685 [Hymenobacter sp. HMF4947]|uniref:Uncharacterized protein n=1 Tax=Hymenobacter ginkgonis TaxID=2682976 RepID=A0A7K1TKK9_9BACT|nr:hypothetical protein [Hymenobacter ginkgonis]MVN78950.1 hypothetical protein [Hymenobacter ginkgonis]